jgi:integrase
MKATLWQPSPDSPYGVQYRDPDTGRYVRRGCVAHKGRWRKGTLAEAEAEVARLNNVLDSSITINRALDWWLADIKPDVKDGTAGHYDALASVFRGFAGDLALSKFTVDTFREFNRFLDARGLAVNTQKVHLCRIRHFIRWCGDSERKWIKDAESICLAIKNPREKNKRKVKIFTSAQLQQFLQACSPAQRWHFEIFVDTGMRREEFARLRWVDIDWERNRIVLPETKSGEEQFIPMTPRVRALLQQRQGAGDTVAFVDMDDLGRAVHVLCESLGFPPDLTAHRPLHIFRHTFASRLFASVVPDGFGGSRRVTIYEAQKLLRHALPSTTLDIYGHLMDGTTEQVIASLAPTIPVLQLVPQSKASK